MAGERVTKRSCSFCTHEDRDSLEEQMLQLKDTAKKLLAEEKYELLQELKEIYDKIKKEYDSL